MYSNFILINNNFLKEFGDESRIKVKDKILNIINKINIESEEENLENYFKEDFESKYRLVYCYCPICKVRGYIQVLSKILKENDIKDFRYCVKCGEANIGYRFITGYNKVKNMISLSSELDFNKNEEVIKTLNQQIVVMMSSVLEIYLRDYYVGVLNTIYIKHNKSLADKFIKDCKNDFLNPDKANDRFKKELGINIKELITSDEFNILKQISAYRNVIVHNNGISDRAFIKSDIGSAYKERELVNISLDNLKVFSDTLINIFEILDLEYHKLILKSLVDDFLLY